MKYPIGIQTLEKIRKGGFVYVDKTDLLYKLVKGGNIFFLSRPRRFGKSLLLSTLKSYFEGRKDLFDGLAIAELETEWNKYPIFHLDFNGKNFSEQDTLTNALLDFFDTYEEEYGITNKKRGMGERFVEMLKVATERYGRKAVVLVDEYDKPMLDVMNTPLEQKNRDILKGFYSVFKLADEYLQFVFLTGVTKFSQISVFSGFNQPDDISMDPRYDALCGITEAELDSYFTERMQEMAAEAGITKEEMRARIKRMYDGYHFSERMTDIYNPFSLLNALSKGILDAFWFRTGTPTYLVKLIEDYNENINEMVGRFYSTSQFIDYKADKQLPLPMIYQSGYLTIKEYNPYSPLVQARLPQ